MECKFHFTVPEWVPGIVLIETLWNVNNNEAYNIERPEKVLIETLWNVNVVTMPNFSESLQY